MIDQALENELARLRIKSEEFSELLVRLMDYGVLCRDESQVEAALYDRFLRCEQLVRSWLAPLGVRLLHEPRFQYLRLYPPGAEVPALPDQEQEHWGGFRARLTQMEVAAALVLRVEYHKAMREGQVDDQGCVPLSLEALELGLRNLLKMSLPDKQGERLALLKRLRRLRLIRFADDAGAGSADVFLQLRPTLVQFVSESALEEVLALAGEEQQPAIVDDKHSLFAAENP